MRASHSHEDRNEAIEAMNDAEDETKVLVTTYDIGGPGVNIHKACHHGIVLQLPRNFSEFYQAIMRLPRLGQRHAVHWDVILDPDSFSVYQFRKLCIKYSRQLMAEARIPVAFQNVRIRLLLVYDIIQGFFGWPFSPYVWELHQPTRIEEYCDADTVFLGKALALVARALLQIADAQDDVGAGDADWLGPALDLITRETFAGATIEQLERETRGDLIGRFRYLAELSEDDKIEMRRTIADRRATANTFSQANRELNEKLRKVMNETRRPNKARVRGTELSNAVVLPSDDESVVSQQLVGPKGKSRARPPEDKEVAGSVKGKNVGVRARARASDDGVDEETPRPKRQKVAAPSAKETESDGISTRSSSHK